MVVLVSGTSRGLGASLAADLTRRGHVVDGSSRAGGTGPRHLALDVTDPSSCEAAVARVPFAEARGAAHRRMLRDGPRGLPLARVADVVARVLVAARPPFRVAVDGFATRLAVARALTPAVVFERLVLRRTAPELLDARSEDAAEPAAR